MAKTVWKQEWEVTISLTGTFKWPVEDGEEDEDSFRKFLRSKDGQDQIVEEFQGALRRNPHLYKFGGDGMETDIVDLIKTETEVGKYDSDPRV